MNEEEEGPEIFNSETSCFKLLSVFEAKGAEECVALKRSTAAFWREHVAYAYT